MPRCSSNIVSGRDLQLLPSTVKDAQRALGLSEEQVRQRGLLTQRIIRQEDRALLQECASLF